MPSGEVCEVSAPLKETLIKSGQSKGAVKETDTNKTKKSFTLQQDIGTMMYDGKTKYTLNYLAILLFLRLAL